MMIRKILSAVCIMVVGASVARTQSWRYTGELSKPRWIHTLTVLGNGTVLAAGGWSDSYLAMGSCEIYDPATESWRSTGSMAVPRSVHTATMLEDGRVVVIGGQVGMGGESNFPDQTDVVEIYDPGTGTWSINGRLLVKRQNHRAILMPDGKILVIGGLRDASPLAGCEMYDPATGTSRAVASMNQARHEHHTVLLDDGKVLVAGGRDGGWNSSYFNQCETYDPTSDSWSIIDPMNQSRIAGTIVRFSDGSVLATGGRDTPNSSAPGAEVLDPSTMQWSSVDPIRRPCTWMASVLFPDDRYLMTGGFYDGNWQQSREVVTTAVCEWYDRWSGRWYLAPSLNQARCRHSSVYIHQTSNTELPRDLVLVSGGHIANGTYTATCEVLDVTRGAVENYMTSLENTTDAPDRDRDAGGHLNLLGAMSGRPIVEFALDSDGYVELDLIGSDGRLVERLVGGEQATGSYRLSLNTAMLADGLYFVRLHAGSYVELEKLAVAR